MPKYDSGEWLLSLILYIFLLIITQDEDDDFDSEDEMEISPQKPKANSKTNSKAQDDASKRYQKVTPLEHVLLRPDTYIGSVELKTEEIWVFDKGAGMNKRQVSYVPGLYKIFDEILVNAADHKQRDPNMNTIKVEINVEENRISVFNNGEGKILIIEYPLLNN